MNTKRLIKVVMMSVCMLISFTSSASTERSQDSNHQGDGSAVLDLHAHEPKTKRAPSTNVLEVVYSDGILTLTSNYYEGTFSMSFENYETAETYETPAIQVGQSVPFALPLGEYQVTATSEYGIVLAGYMQVY